MDSIARRLVAIASVLLATQAGAQGIYTCVDAQGRRLTSDRPIVDCIDREQKELNPSGTVKRRVGPSPTAAELAAEEERQRKLAEDRHRIAEEKRRNRALLTRYRNPESHHKERAAALAVVDEVTATARTRITELRAQRNKYVAELEFYKDPAKVPAALSRSIEQTDKDIAAQERFIADQTVEKQRINARFDEELARLKLLWGEQAVPVVSPAPAATSATR